MVSGLESQRRMEWRSERKREVIWMNYKDGLLVRKRLSCYSGETPSSSVLNKMEFHFSLIEQSRGTCGRKIEQVNMTSST